jgi:hypothetical protein
MKANCRIVFVRSEASVSNNHNKEVSNDHPSNIDNSAVQVTEACAKRLVELMSNSTKSSLATKFLRVSVEGGGCSGFQYKFEMDEGSLRVDDR